MAKENTVQLYGWVNSLPKINATVDADGDDLFVSGKIHLTTVRRSYATDDFRLRGTLRWDSPIVFTRNHHLIKHQMQKLNMGTWYLSAEPCVRKKCPNGMSARIADTKM